MKIERIPVDAVVVGNRRPANGATVSAIAASMRVIGQLQPITVYEADGSAHLIAGRHRLEAAQFLGWDDIEAVFVTGDEIDRRLREISENLHRAELTVQERSDQITEWSDLIEQKAKVSELRTPGGKQPAERGIRKTARELNISKTAVSDARKIASITPEAKEAAQDAGIDDNQSKLLEVAKAPPEQQVAKVYELKGVPLSKNWRDQFQTLWGKGTEDDHAWARDYMDKPIMDKQFG